MLIFDEGTKTVESFEDSSTSTGFSVQERRVNIGPSCWLSKQIKDFGPK
jgi:hypothetical protein